MSDEVATIRPYDDGYLPVVPLNPDDNPYEPARRGRPLSRPMAFYERGLWELAIAGGNGQRAADSLAQQGYEGYSARSLRDWMGGRFRNRYHDICRAAVRELDEQRAQQAGAIATRIAHVEDESLRQILSRLSATDAVEASVVLRNVSQSKKIQEDNAAALRGTSAQHVAARGLHEIVGALERLGVTVVDGDAVEDAVVVD